MDPTTSRSERRFRRFEQERGRVPERWGRQGASETVVPGGTGLVSITLDAGTDIRGRRYLALEAAMAAMGMTIVSKKSTRFAETVVVRGDLSKLLSLRPKFEDVIDILAPMGAPVPSAAAANGWLPPGPSGLSATATCSVEQAMRQVGALDIITGGRKNEIRNNKGEGAIVIVWDFLWKLTNAPEFTERTGGAPKLLLSSNVPANDHGSQVASACCGSAVGLATGSVLGLLPVISDVLEPLGVIDLLVQRESERPPGEQRAIIVNMSFQLGWNSDAMQDYGDDVRRLVEIWNSAMNTLLREYPRLIFVNAAGNNGEDACVLGLGSNAAACPALGCYEWPTFGAARSGLDPAPVLRVGSVHATTATFPAKVAVPEYSNRGTCVRVWAHGLLCLYTSSSNGYAVVTGTSFASPIVSAQLALILTARPSWSAQEAVNFLRTSGQAMPAENGAGVLSRLDPEAISRDSLHGGAGADWGLPSVQDTVDTVADDVANNSAALSSPPATPSEMALIVIGVIVLVVALFMGARALQQFVAVRALR